MNRQKEVIKLVEIDWIEVDTRYDKTKLLDVCLPYLNLGYEIKIEPYKELLKFGDSRPDREIIQYNVTIFRNQHMIEDELEVEQ